ncbi:MAG: hypothetical protein H3C55_14120 [Pseudorhodoplanes sp.]|nr:hypothetical protein [Pseudorhodoplanes sp.]MBW7950469.1 hypothetical protein [Pseudorhodoplanes sp.]MCQ3943387.1 hypothetical protein [Alphaproteobacteria bacterium]
MPRFARVVLLLLAMAGSAAAPAAGAEYRDPQDVFSVTYDDGVWEREDEQELSLQCREEACGGAIVGCFFTKEPANGAPAAVIMRSFDAAQIARAQIEAFADQKERLEREFSGVIEWNKAVDVAPVVTQPYAPRTIAGLPFQVAEFRLSMLGQVARYASYMTAADGYSIAAVCHASEEAYPRWRPRFEALVEALRIAGPAPAPR